MARIQLRDTTIYLQDGLSGAGVINDAAPADLTGVTELTLGACILNTADVDLIPVGARFTLAAEVGAPVHTVTARTPAAASPTTVIEFTPAVTSNIADDAAITFLPQRLEIKIGDGDVSWTESREFIYDLDRDRLDTVRQGQEQPVSIDMAFVFDYVTTESGQEVTPIDALKQVGEATEWVTSSSDPCEPYAVDIYVLHCVPCGTDEDQDLLFSDFRYESLEYSLKDASISVSGRCNITDVTSSRGSLC